MSTRIPLILMLAVAGATASATGASAATPSTAFAPFATPNPEPQANARWGERLVVAGDQNGDGVNDLYTSTPSADGSYPDQGRVYLLDGKDRSIMRAIDSPEPQGGTAFGFTATSGAKFGFYISVPGDLNGDTKNDVVVGTDAQNVYVGTGPGGAPNTAPCGAPEPNGCNEGQGKAWAFSGASGAVLRTFDNPDPQGIASNRARFGSRIGRAGDVTADGVADIIIGASSNDVPAGCGDATPVPAGCRKDQGQAYVFNGATGARVRTLDLPAGDQTGTSCAANCGQLGISVQGPGDVNRDGTPDQLVDAGNYDGVGRMYLFSGRDGSVLLRIDDPDPQQGAFFGFQDAAPDSPGDVNGDGTPDLYAHGFQQDVAGLKDQGRAWVFSGTDGRLIYTIDDPTPTEGGTFGFSLSKTDYNKDATQDLYIGQAPHGGGDENGGTYVFDGRDASLLKSLEVPAGDRQLGMGGPSLGFTSVAPGDLNGDGEPDYVAGAPFFDEGGLANNGRIYAFMSTAPPAPAVTPPGSTPPVTPPGVIPPGVAPPTVIIPSKLPRVSVAAFTARVSPSRDRRSPFRFTVSGAVRRPAGIAASACKGGRVSVQTKVGSKTVSTRRTTLRSDCSYRVALTFSNPRRLGRGRLTLRVRFLGNDRFKPAATRTLSARAG